MILSENLSIIDQAAQAIANFVYHQGNQATTVLDVENANLAMGCNKAVPPFDIRETWIEIDLSHGITMALQPLNQYDNTSFAIPNFPSTVFINADSQTAIVDCGPDYIRIMENWTPKKLKRIQSELTAAVEKINQPIAA